MFEPGELVKRIQQMRDDGHLSDALLRFAVRQIEDSDDRFDWVGAYLVREGEEGEELWLHNYMGSPTEHASIPVGKGVCGRAVSERKNQHVPDVSQEPGYLTDSDDVQSEMAVLIRAGDDVFGILDIDSETQAAFTEEDELAVQATADKLAEQLAAERR